VQLSPFSTAATCAYEIPTVYRKINIVSWNLYTSDTSLRR